MVIQEHNYYDRKREAYEQLQAEGRKSPITTLEQLHYYTPAAFRQKISNQYSELKQERQNVRDLEIQAYDATKGLDPNKIYTYTDPKTGQTVTASGHVIGLMVTKDIQAHFSNVYREFDDAEQQAQANITDAKNATSN